MSRIETNTYATSRERIKKETSAGRTYYAWGGSSVLCEYTETATTPNWAKSYIYAGSRLLSTITKNGSSELTEYHHPDRLGTKVVSDTALNTFKEQSTLPFGAEIPAETVATSNQKFTSYDRSGATGLDYAVNRTYNSGQSRFTQVDPIGMASTSIGDPQSMNLFSYTQNNPIDFSDPIGLDSHAPCGGPGEPPCEDDGPPIIIEAPGDPWDNEDGFDSWGRNHFQNDSDEFNQCALYGIGCPAEQIENQDGLPSDAVLEAGLKKAESKCSDFLNALFAALEKYGKGLRNEEGQFDIITNFRRIGRKEVDSTGKLFRKYGASNRARSITDIDNGVRFIIYSELSSTTAYVVDTFAELLHQNKANGGIYRDNQLDKAIKTIIGKDEFNNRKEDIKKRWGKFVDGAIAHAEVTKQCFGGGQ